MGKVTRVRVDCLCGERLRVPRCEEDTSSWKSDTVTQVNPLVEMEEHRCEDHNTRLPCFGTPPPPPETPSPTSFPPPSTLLPLQPPPTSPRYLLLLLTTCSTHLLHHLKAINSIERFDRRSNLGPPRNRPEARSRGRRRDCTRSFAARFLLLSWLLVAWAPFAAAEQKFAMQPMDQTAIVNSRVTLPCRIINRAGAPQWTKDDFALGTNRNISGYDDRYAMIGSDEEGDFSLDIHPVRLEDDARYQCQVAAGPNGEPGIRSRFATLTVLVPPEPPRILPQPGDVVTPAGSGSESVGKGLFIPSNPMSLLTTEDREIQLECVSKGGKPAAEITWIDGIGNVLKDGVEYMTELLPDKKRLTAKSILRLTPRREHHRQVFTCQAQNAADRTYRSARVRLLVNYAPKVTVNVSAIRRPIPPPIHRPEDEVEEGGGVYALAGGPEAGVALGSSTAMASSASHTPSATTITTGSLIREFDEVRLTCLADANPDTDLVYRWFINDEPVTGGVISGTGAPPGIHGELEGGNLVASAVAVDPTVLVISNVSRGFHDAIVKCEVHNAVGKSEESETLDISYGPRFRIRPQSVEAEEGSTVSMSCDVDGNPPADILWVHEPTDKVVGTSPNLTLHAGPDTAGRYRCTARVPTPNSAQQPQPDLRQGKQTPLQTLEFPVATAWAWLRLRGPPSIVSRRVQFGVRGDTVRLECVALSVPRPERVVWTRAGRDVDANDRDFSVLEDPLPEGIKSTLVIRDSQDQHFGPYNCTVTNPYGSDGLEIILKKQKTFPLLIIIFGAIGGIIVIVLVAMLVIMCHKKTKKPDGTDEEKQTKVAGAVIQGQGVQPQHHHMQHIVHTHQSDRSSNNSDVKAEIRTASSLSNTLNERDSTGPWCEEDDEEDGDVRISAVDDVDANGIVTTTGLVPGGPVVLGPRMSIMTTGVELGFRYSAAGGGSVAPEYPEPAFPPKPEGANNNGYVPYVDYARDYNPPTIHDALRVKSTVPPPPPSYGATVDPRYNATYGNPYLRTPPPPPPLSSGGSSSSLPPPPPSNHTLSEATSPTSPVYTPPATSTVYNAPGMMATSNSTYGVAPAAGPLSASGNQSSYGTLKAGTTPPPAPSSSSASSSPSGTLTYAAGKGGENVRNGAVPQVARLPTSPTRHYIVPSHHQQPSVVKRGTLATHV